MYVGWTVKVNTSFIVLGIKPFYFALQACQKPSRIWSMVSGAFFQHQLSSHLCCSVPRRSETTLVRTRTWRLAILSIQCTPIGQDMGAKYRQLPTMPETVLISGSTTYGRTYVTDLGMLIHYVYIFAKITYIAFSSRVVGFYIRTLCIIDWYS